MSAQPLLAIHTPVFVRAGMPRQNLEPVLMDGDGSPVRCCIKDILMTFRR